MWKRCSEGQTWTGSSCAGKAREISWNEAMPNAEQKSWRSFAGHSDWRVPTKEELKTLVYCSSGKPKTWNDIIDDDHPNNEICDGEFQEPSIEQIAFPNTPRRFWTASPSSDFCCSRDVYFDNGYVGRNYRYNVSAVRLVRSGQ